MKNLNSFVKHGCKQQNHRSDLREHREDFAVGTWGSPSGLLVSKLKVQPAYILPGILSSLSSLRLCCLLCFFWLFQETC